MRCSSWALVLFHTVGLGSELNTVSSLQLAVSSLLLRRKFRVMGDKIRKNLSHPSMNACHHTTEPPFFNEQFPRILWNLCSQHQQQQFKNTSRCRRVRTSASQKTEEPTTKAQRANWFCCLVKRCACIVRDGVHMIHLFFDCGVFLSYRTNN